MRRLLSLALVGLIGLAAVSQAQEFELPKPTSEHQLLMKDLGVWDAEVKTFMDPSAPPEVSKAVETNTQLGDFFLKSEFKGEFGGVPFVGNGLFGFDTNKKKYIGTWADTMSPSIMIQEGTYDEKTGELTMIADSVDMTGKPAKIKTVSKHLSPDKRSFTMYMKSEATGPDFVKNMEVVYTRRK